MAGLPTPDTLPATPGNLGAPSFGPQPPEDHDLNDKNKSKADNKMAPDVIALQQKLNEEQKARERAEKENKDLKAAKSSPKKDITHNDVQIQARNPEEAFDTETRSPLGRIIHGVLGKTMGKFLRDKVQPGPQTALGFSGEIRKPNWFKKFFLKIPFIGLLAPAGMINLHSPGFSFPAVFPEGLYQQMTSVGTIAQAGKEIVGASINPALSVGILGGIARGGVDAIRWAVMKEKTMHLFARELVNRGTDGSRSMDSGAVWNTVMGDRADIAQLLDLSNEFTKAGGSVKDLMLDKGEMKRLIKRAFGSKLEKLTLERIVSAEGMAKLTPDEKLHLQNVDTAFEVAEAMFDSMTPMERVSFLQDELPQYLQRREVTNHLKAMGKRAAIAGFKTSLVGMAASLFGTLSKTGLFADWGKRIGDTVSTGVTNIKDYVTNWYNGAKGSGLLKWFNNIPITGTNAAALPTGPVVPKLRAPVPLLME